jgi:hypothetical protein
MNPKNIPIEIKPSDRLICSFPRSGNTWVRRLISDVALQTSGFDTSQDEIGINIESVIPMFEPYQMDPRIKLKHRLIKTHLSYRDGFKHAVYILRRPEDVLISYFHHKNYQTGVFPPEGIDRFCLNRVKSWSTHVDSWLQAKSSGYSRVFVCIYERLHAEPMVILNKLLAFLELDASPIVIKRAVENQQFLRLQQMEKKKKPGKDSMFFRKGKVGGYEHEIQAETFEEIRENTDPLYQRALRMFQSDMAS